jgi:hypothetical protein
MNVKQKRCALSEAQENFLFFQSQKAAESKREKPKDVPSEGVASTTTEEHEKGSLYSVGQVVEGRWHQEAQDGWCHHRKIFSHNRTVCIQLSGRVCPGSRHRKPHSKLCPGTSLPPWLASGVSSCCGGEEAYLRACHLSYDSFPCQVSENVLRLSGKHYFYAATVEKVHQGGKEYTVRAS